MNHIITQRNTFLSLITGILFFVGCGSSGVNIFTKQQDVDFGKQLQAEIAKHPADYPVLDNPNIQSYVQGIVNRIIQAPTVINKDFHYTVTIIHDDKTVNAFTIPGGPMYVYTGLLKFIDNEATLAGIMAHEITHADHRHSTQQMTKQYGLAAVTQMALGNNPGLVAKIAGSLADNLTMLSFSRADETEADATSFDDLMALSGRPWYPAAIRAFMLKTLTKTNQLEKLFMTHPPSQERLDAINAKAKAAKLPEPTENQLNSIGYQRMKAMLP